MVSQENSVYTSFRPIQILATIFGFCPYGDMRTKPRLTVFGTIHVVLLLSVKICLIYYNLDRSKFAIATNSTILNSGLWIQIEASLIISILYILLGIKKGSSRWALLKSFKEIDDELQKSFYVKYHYVQIYFKKSDQLTTNLSLITSWIATGTLLQFILSNITGYYLWNIPFDFWHRWSIYISICLSNICIFSLSHQFVCGQLYLSSRFQNINAILSQLIFDQPISNDLRLVENESINVVSETLASVVKNVQTKNVKRNAFERTEKLDIVIMDTMIERTKRPIHNEFPLHLSPAMESKSVSFPRYKKTKRASIFILVRKTCISKLAFTKSSTLPEILKKLDQLMELHDRLSDCVDQCNYLLALEVLLITLTIFVYIVFGFFAKYRVWMDYQYEAENVAQMNIYWIIFYSGSIILGTHLTSNLMQKVQETSVIVHKIACRKQNAILLNKLSQISQMLYSRKTTVGCGLIVYNWPTIFSLFGCVCMYLIILIQFYLSGRSNKIHPVLENYKNHTELI